MLYSPHRDETCSSRIYIICIQILDH
jgi:hypothetical protein